MKCQYCDNEAVDGVCKRCEDNEWNLKRRVDWMGMRSDAEREGVIAGIIRKVKEMAKAEDANK